jgi:hypothetical protein
MRADQLRLSAYEVHILRSVLRDWRQFHITSAGAIPARDLDQLEDRLDRVDVDSAEARARTGQAPFTPADLRPPISIGLGAPGDVPHTRHPLTFTDSH